MIKWIIIAAVVVVLIGVLVLSIYLGKKKGKKTAAKLADNIKKVQAEKDDLVHKQQVEADKKKEADAFANITLTDDVEDEFSDLFAENIMPQPAVKPAVNAKKDDLLNLDDIFPAESRPREARVNKKSRDEEFDDFLNEHSFTRKVFDGELLEQIKNLPPKLKAIVLGNVFDKFED